jgi:hypothetical protein
MFVLLTAAREQDRLWAQYQHMKNTAKYERMAREQIERKKKRVAQKADLQTEPMPIAPTPQASE